ncbi:MAG: hypothetical protein DYG92_04740 [Leptolyngbya sp. PLA1]|nr:hypothetical protein [Leptolyngbya sp. PLA1]
MMHLFAHPLLKRSLFVIAPFVVVKVGGDLLGGGGPARVTAAPLTAEAPEAAPRPVRPDDDLSAWERGTLGPTALNSPMSRLRVIEEPRDEPAMPAPAARTVEPAPSGPTMVLSGVLGGRGSQAAAIVNGRLRRVGESVSPGYRLIAVDAPARSARVEGPDGTVTVLVIQR